VQRELPKGILLDVAYVGTLGTHLPSRLTNSNVPSTDYILGHNMQYDYTTGTDCTTIVKRNMMLDPLNGSGPSNNTCGSAFPDPQLLPPVQRMPIDQATGLHAPYAGFFNTWGGSAQLGQAMRPFPQFSTDTVEGLSQLRDFGEVLGTSAYNALQVQARKHFSQNLSFLVSYTYSKTLTNAEAQFNEFSGFTQDFHNSKAEKSLSINDYPNNMVIAYEYLLPFGPGQKFANHGGVAGKLIGGWTISGVQSYTSGSPSLIVYGGAVAGYPYAGPNSFIARANVVPGVPKKSAALRNGTWDPNGVGEQGAIYNVDAWSAPNVGQNDNYWTFGGAPRTDGNARRFGWLQEDISVIKRTRITERVNVEFRADFFNIFNRTVFGFDQGGDQYGSIIGGNNISSGPGGFGHVSAQANFPREIQFGLKLNY